MTQHQLLTALAKAPFLTDKELDIAYNQASVNGWGDLCDIYFNEHNRRMEGK